MERARAVRSASSPRVRAASNTNRVELCSVKGRVVKRGGQGGCGGGGGGSIKDHMSEMGPEVVRQASVIVK